MGNGPNYISQAMLTGKTNYKKDTQDVADKQLQSANPALGPTPAEELQANASAVLNTAASAVDMQVGSKEVDSPTTFKYADAISTATGGNTMAQSAQMGMAAGMGIRQKIQEKAVKEGKVSKWGTDMLQNNEEWKKKNPMLAANMGWV